MINVSSGGCDDTSVERLLAAFDHAGLSPPKVRSVTSDGLEAALDGAIGACDVLVVLGGDGTIMTAAERCRKADLPLIPLPGGTMNMLCKALYGDAGWEQVLAGTLAAPEERVVSGGRAEGRPFYCAAILGAPALWADVREALRRLDLPRAFGRAMTAIRRHGQNRLTYRMDGAGRGEAEAIGVICPLVSPTLDNNARALEVVALDLASAAEAFSLAISAMFADWRHDPSVERARVTTITVIGHGQIPVILDGETVKMGRAVSITFLPTAFRALVPARRP